MCDYPNWCSLLIHVKYDWSRSSCTNSFTRGSTPWTHLLPPSLSHAPPSPSPSSNAVSPTFPLSFSPTIGDVVSSMRTLQRDFNSASSDTVFLTSETTLCHSLASWSASIPDSCKTKRYHTCNHTCKDIAMALAPVRDFHIPVYIHIQDVTCYRTCEDLASLIVRFSTNYTIMPTCPCRRVSFFLSPLSRSGRSLLFSPISPSRNSSISIAALPCADLCTSSVSRLRHSLCGQTEQKAPDLLPRHSSRSVEDL